MFDEILEGDYDQEIINHAIIFKINDALNNDSNIDSILNDFNFVSKEPFMNSLYNTLVGDYYYSNKSFNEAVQCYKTALNDYDNYKDILIDVKISLIMSYIKLNQFDNAANELKSVNLSNLSKISKDKFNIFSKECELLLK